MFWKRKYDPFKELKKLRDRYSDEIPLQVLSGKQVGKDYKVRKNWWHGLFGELDQVIQSLPEEEHLLKNSITIFCNKYGRKESDFRYRLTTKEDIAEANVLIDKVLAWKKANKKSLFIKIRRWLQAC